MLAIRRASLLVVLAGLLATAGLGDALAQTKGNTAPKPDSAAPPTLTFHIYKDKGGKFRFRLKDSADVSVAVATTGYETKAECQKMIDAVIAGAAKAKVVDEAK
jgi:uncharacterized protein YegP (UPF0339 family)